MLLKVEEAVGSAGMKGIHETLIGMQVESQNRPLPCI